MIYLLVNPKKDQPRGRLSYGAEVRVSDPGMGLLATGKLFLLPHYPYVHYTMGYLYVNIPKKTCLRSVEANTSNIQKN